MICESNNRKLDLLLINPGARSQVYGELSASLSGIEPPLWCGLLAGYVRAHGHSVKIIDAEAENWSPRYTAEKIAEYNPYLAAVIVLGANPSAASTPKMTATGEILRELKKIAPDIKTLLGGIHPSALPEKTLEEEVVDFICLGEGFRTIDQLLNVLIAGDDVEHHNIGGLYYRQNGNVISNSHIPTIENLDALPLPAWDILPMNKYRAHNWHCFDHIKERQPYAVVYTSLGCPFNCSYCNIHTLYGKSGIRFRSPEKVIQEIDLLVKNYKVKNIKIIDEMFALKQDHVIRICDLIIQGGYDLNIWAYARVDTVNEVLLGKMKRAGINWLAFGIESSSTKAREGVSKRFSQDAIRRAIEMTHAAGIYVMGNFIFGLPDDSFQTMRETLDLAKELNCEYVNFYTVMAYPGSQLYHDAVRSGIRLPEQWHGYSQYAEETLPLPTKYLSAAEVLRFRDNAFKEYFSNPEYQEMILEKFGTDVLVHIKEMLKKEIHRNFA